MQILALYPIASSIPKRFSIPKLGPIVIDGLNQNLARTYFDVFSPCERFVSTTYSAGPSTSSHSHTSRRPILSSIISRTS
jgi:hypothetical protein